VLLALGALPTNETNSRDSYLADVESALFSGVRAVQEYAVLSGHQDEVDLALFDIEGSRILTMSADGTARLWDPKRAKELSVVGGADSRVLSIAFDANNTAVALIGSSDGLHLWDVARKQELYPPIRTDRTVLAVLSANARNVFTASADGAARVLDVSTGQ